MSIGEDTVCVYTLFEILGFARFRTRVVRRITGLLGWCWGVIDSDNDTEKR